MKNLKMVVPALLLFAAPALAVSQEEGLLPTQALVRADSKLNVILDPASVALEVENKSAQLRSLKSLKPGTTQIALLIDDGLSPGVGVQLGDLKAFVQKLPAGTEILIGYMSNGRVEVAQPFTTDYAAAAKALRLPTGAPGQSASPYFCLSDFVKRWPESNGKARFAMMITNGVDPYNGSTSLLNQDSPYVQTAADDAERAGVAVYSIYYQDAGFGGGLRNSISGQSYLQQVAAATGGESYYEGTGSPVSLKPFLEQFQHALAETYVASFEAPATGGGRSHLVRLKMTTTTPKLKLRHPEQVRPGNRENSRGE